MKRSNVVVVAVAIISFFNSFSSSAQKLPFQIADVDIVRDQWGVPHIFAPTDEGVAYGLGWATCEDDFETLQWLVLAAKGMMGRHLGKEGAVFDYARALLRVEEVVDEKYETDLSPRFRSVMEAYVAGVNSYAKKFPKEVLVKKAFPVTARDMVQGYVLALAVMTRADKTLKNIFEGKVKSAKKNEDGVGSNTFAFGPNKTKDGNTYLAVNSHQPVEGPLSWYEVHLCSEEGWNIIGGLFHGAVSIFHGTNEHLAWAHTMNEFDMIDVFELEMHPTEKNLYRFDGEWLELEERKAKLNVKIFKRVKLAIPVKKKVWWSKYGATLKTDNGVFSVRLAANQNIKASEQWYWMNKAKDFEEFREALDIQGMGRASTFYADRKNIYGLSNGLVPKRNPNFVWSGTVPGNTSATLWTEFYSVDELPQVLNPDCGYIYNVNNSPFEATCEEENQSMADFDKATGFNMAKTNRSQRVKELMRDYDSLISWEDFRTIKFDRKLPDSLIFIRGINLNDIFKINPERHSGVADAILKIKNWNRRGDTTNTDMPIFLYTVYNIFDELKHTTFHTYDVDRVKREGLFVRNIRKAKKQLLDQFGTIDVPLGKVQLLVRGDKELPLGGGPDFIKAAYCKPYKGRYKLFAGESYIQLVKFTDDGVKLETISPFGASNKLDSPHSTNQMEMYIHEELKPMTFDKNAIYDQAESVYHPQ